jgi:hypothetical protein
MELLARDYMRDRRFRLEGWERCRMVASAAINASRYLLLVVLPRKSHVFCYKYRVSMSCLAQVGQQRASN